MSQPELDRERGPMARRAMKYTQEQELRNHLANVFLTSTAMQTLLGVAQRAGSLEEIEIILRYQQAREPRAWTQPLVDQILKDLREAATRLHIPKMSETEADRLKVEAAAQQLSLIVRVHKVVKAAHPNERDRNER